MKICIAKTLVFLLVLIGSLGCNTSSEQLQDMVLVKGRGGVSDFWMDVSPVTVAEFKRFVAATGYVTEAEKFGDSGVFDFSTGQWELVKGAMWLYPSGRDSAAAESNHPVTQVSWNDARVYAEWAGKRLPTSAEFLFAERNGNENYEETYTWGADFKDDERYKANFWQGVFPVHNTVEDGFLTTSPVGHFGKNALGLTDMGGNVWQWCEEDSNKKVGEKTQRGGSFLCDPMVCHGFKVGGVASSSPESGLFHVGFRCAKSNTVE